MSNPTSADVTSSRHVLPGEHQYDGDTYAACFPPDLLPKIREFKFRDDDFVLVTYPKSGTNWMQEIMYLIQHEGRQCSSEIPLSAHQKAPILEMRGPPPEKKSWMDILETRDSPRLIKSHQGARFFTKALESKQTKFVILMRNIKDTIVSYYHFYRSNAYLGNFKGTFGDFFELFKEKRLAQGDWFHFVKGWWPHRDNPNVCFFMYETMKQDLPSEVKRLASFMGKDLSDDVIATICQQVSLESMKNNPTLNGSRMVKIIDPKISPLIRKGRVGDWKNHFDDEQLAYLERMYRKEMEGVEWEFQHE